MLEITSLQNERVKSAVSLRQRRDRDRQGRFLVEGYRELLHAAEQKAPIQELFICPELFLGTNEFALIASLDVPTHRCSRRVFEKLSYRDRPDGLLGIATHFSHGLEALKGSLFVVAEAIEKPGNLGTILRVCDACAVDGVIVCDRCTDVYNPNVVRASVGTLFTRPVVEAEGKETLCWLKDLGVKVVAATPAASALHTEVDLTGPVAVAFGTEQLGLSESWLEAADIQVRLPMFGRADSLNVAISAAVLLYEIVRQRGGGEARGAA